MAYAEISCPCGVTYTPKDIYAKNQHEASARHQKWVKLAAEEEAQGSFSDLDLDEPVVEKPKRTRKTKIPVTFEDLDKTDAAKSFTPDERLTICNLIATMSGATDLSVPATDVVDAFIDAVPDGQKINSSVLPDLKLYALGVVTVIRASEARETPVETKPAKTKAVKTPKVVNVMGGAGNHKVCRVCGKDKPLDDYRRKSSRPDGRDTICAACSKDWLIAHRAKKAVVK